MKNNSIENKRCMIEYVGKKRLWSYQEKYKDIYSVKPHNMTNQERLAELIWAKAIEGDVEMIQFLRKEGFLHTNEKEENPFECNKNIGEPEGMELGIIREPDTDDECDDLDEAPCPF